MDYAGFSLDGAGDVNGDGYDDIIIGAYGFDKAQTNIGIAYIIFGRSSGWVQNQSLSQANSSFFGENQEDRAGYSVAGAGDVNGDGFDDVLVGSYLNDEAHAIKFVREFTEKEPYEAESWFYGEVDETEERIVIKISANGERELLEIFVASSNLASLTGLLAELGNEFRKKVEEMGITEDELRLQTDQRTKEVVKHTRLLLDKYAEAEADVDEIDQT